MSRKRKILIRQVSLDKPGPVVAGRTPAQLSLLAAGRPRSPQHR
jgi:hypothetical protein